MRANETTYRVVLRRDDASEFVRRNLSALKHVFSTMDQLALRVRDEDEQLMEVVNSLADLLRGVLSDRHGVDISPDSDMGPDEPIDTSHAIRVLAQVVGSDPPFGYAQRVLSEEDRIDFVRSVVAIEQGILALESDLQERGVTQDGDGLADIKRNVAKLKAIHVSAPSDSCLPDPSDSTSS